MVDDLANFAYGTVATPPSPPTSGTTLTLQAGQGAVFPTEPFDLLFWPPEVNPLTSNAELARCTNVTGDVLTFTRAQYGTTAQAVAVGFQVSQPIDAHLLTQIAGGGAVSSVFTRTGAVVATSGDYSVAEITGAAPLASPTFTGTPAAPTASPLTDTTQLATTAYTDLAVGVETTRAEAAEALKLALAGGTMTGAIAMGSHKITGLTNGSSAQDAAAFGQIPAALPPSGTAGGDLSGTYPNPGVANLNGIAAAAYTLSLVPTAVKTSAYNAVAGDFIPCNVTSAGFTVTLPTAPADKTRIGIKVVATASSHVLTMACGGSDVFNVAAGPTTGTLTLLNQGVVFQYAASPAIWYAQSTDFPASQTGLALEGTFTAAGQLYTGTGSGTGTLLSGGTTGQVLTAVTSAAPSWAAVAGGLAVFGDGSDGAQTFDGTTTILGMVPSASTYTLTRDIYLGSSTINNGVTIKTSSYRLSCQGTLTNNGTISNDGNNGTTGGNGGGNQAASGSNSTLFGNQGAAGQGGNGATGNGATGTATTTSQGGAGGAGGTGVTTTGGTSGGATGPGAKIGTLHDGINAMSAMAITSSQSANAGQSIFGGGGGGAGGGDATNNGGGGGSGGFGLWIAVRVFAGTGAMHARGGNGGNGAVASTLGAGGGGGGGGGWVVVVSSSVSGGAITGQTIDAAGGNGGTHQGATATDGASGSAGTVVLIPN